MMLDIMPLYKKMLEIRILEDKLQELCLTTDEGNDWHFSKGQEAISVGVCSQLRPTDYILSHHRSIAPAVARGVALQPLVDELLGKSTGLLGGRGGEMHFHDDSTRFMSSFQLVGSVIPVGIGISYASKYYYKTDNLVAISFGDACTANGQFHEGCNIAATKQTPTLFVIEDNALAGNVRPMEYMPFGVSVKDRFLSYNIEAIDVDGCKIDDVVEKAKAAVKYIRKNLKPYALICDTVRLSYHKQGQSDIRDATEKAELERRDPIEYVERTYLKDIPEAELIEIKGEISRKINQAIAAGRAAPWPSPDKVLLDNYNS